VISKLDLKGASVDTKFGLGNPSDLVCVSFLSQIFFFSLVRRIWPVKPGDHSPTRLKELVQASVTALNGVKIRTLYLHKPDRSVPFEETVSAIDELHKQGVLCVSIRMVLILVNVWFDQ
jgi:aryl-alcohol dehydrogenase-like predicted oxidoreductase